MPVHTDSCLLVEALLVYKYAKLGNKDAQEGMCLRSTLGIISFGLDTTVLLFNIVFAIVILLSFNKYLRFLPPAAASLCLNFRLCM